MTALKERPILFSGSMVQAILDGRKTQTRRLVKPQPPGWIDDLHGGEFRKRAPYELCCNETGCIYGYGFETEDQAWKCPHGKPGDRLWVRETWRLYRWLEGEPYAVQFAADNGVHECNSNSLEADFKMESWCESVWRSSCSELIRLGVMSPDDAVCSPEAQERLRWRPSIHMPRWASRITLEITDIRAQRVQEISHEDAIAEGATSRDVGLGKGWSMDWSEVGRLSPYASGVTNRAEPNPLTEYDVSLATPWAAFGNYWIKLNGPESWDANPWVWAITFKRID